MSALSTRTAEKQVEQTSQPTIRDLVRAQQPAIEAQLAGTINSGAFVRAAISTIMASDDLQNASPASILGAIMLAAQLRLEIGPALGHFYLTPRKVDGKQTCLPIIGYQGYIELAYRSGRIDKIETFLIREGDQFDHGANSERGRFFDWTPADYDEKREWTGVVAMARKTGIRALSPYLPKSVELGRALEADEQKVEQVAGIPDLIVTRTEGEIPRGEMTEEEFDKHSAAEFAKQQDGQEPA